MSLTELELFSIPFVEKDVLLNSKDYKFILPEYSLNRRKRVRYRKKFTTGSFSNLNMGNETMLRLMLSDHCHLDHFLKILLVYQTNLLVLKEANANFKDFLETSFNELVRQICRFELVSEVSLYDRYAYIHGLSMMFLVQGYLGHSFDKEKLQYVFKEVPLPGNPLAKALKHRLNIK